MATAGEVIRIIRKRLIIRIITRTRTRMRLRIRMRREIRIRIGTRIRRARIIRRPLWGHLAVRPTPSGAPPGPPLAAKFSRKMVRFPMVPRSPHVGFRSLTVVYRRQMPGLKTSYFTAFWVGRGQKAGNFGTF